MYHFIEITKEEIRGKNRNIEVSVIIPDSLFLDYLQEQLIHKPLFITNIRCFFFLSKPFIQSIKSEEANRIKINSPFRIELPSYIFKATRTRKIERIIQVLLSWLDTSYFEFQKSWNTNYDYN